MSLALGTNAGTVRAGDTVYEIDPAAVHEKVAVPNIMVFSLELYEDSCRESEVVRGIEVIAILHGCMQHGRPVEVA